MKQLTSTLIVTCLSWFFFSCESETMPPETGYAKGRILISMPTAEPFIESGTRAPQTLTNLKGYTFTLSGTDKEGNAVNGVVNFEDNSCIIPAGIYTLTADNKTAAETDLGAAYYHGTSASFTLIPGGSTQVPTIKLGTPQNTRIDLTLDNTFKELYNLQSLSLNNGSRIIILDANNLRGFMMVPENNTLTYTIKAKAKQGTHVSDLPAEGLTKSLTVTPGYAYRIILTAQVIEDIKIEIGEGSHEGEFDAPAEKFPWNLKKLENLETLDNLEQLEQLE